MGMVDVTGRGRYQLYVVPGLATGVSALTSAPAPAGSTKKLLTGERHHAPSQRYDLSHLY